jgi:RES domain-containing protein
MKGKHAAARWMLVAAVLAAKYAFAQGCASCYTTTAAGGTQTIHALRNGILVLLVPPAVMFVGVMLVIRTWKGKTDS